MPFTRFFWFWVYFFLRKGHTKTLSNLSHWADQKKNQTGKFTFPTTRIWVYPTNVDWKWRSKSWSFCWWCYFLCVGDTLIYTCWFQQVSSFQDLDHMRIWMKKSFIEAWKHGATSSNLVGSNQTELAWWKLRPTMGCSLLEFQWRFSVGISGHLKKVMSCNGGGFPCNPGWSKGGVFQDVPHHDPCLRFQKLFCPTWIVEKINQ